MLKRLSRVVRSVFGQVRPLDTRLEEEKRIDPEVAAFEKALAKKKATGETEEPPVAPANDTTPATDAPDETPGKTLG